MNRNRTRPVIASMKKNLIGLAVAAAIVTSLSAFADEPCDHDGARGEYVTQPVQQWVPGHYETVYVPFCPGNRFGFVRCHGGRSESRWVPGYYATVQQSVWVPAPVRTFGPNPYGEYQSDRHHSRLGRVSFRFGGR